MSNQNKKTGIRNWVLSQWTSSPVYKMVDTYVSEKCRRRLKNDEFTILCSNCIGGIIYHRLGKRFLSPTINLFLFQPDFVAFCVYLDYYLDKELRFIESEHDYPVAHLEGDGRDIPTITIYFNHDKEESTARANWEDRKKRIRRDNLFIILYNLDGMTVEQLRALEQVECRNKVVLTPKPLPEIPWSHYIKPNIHHQDSYNYLHKNLFGVRYFERRFDFVSFLNSTME